VIETEPECQDRNGGKIMYKEVNDDYRLQLPWSNPKLPRPTADHFGALHSSLDTMPGSTPPVSPNRAKIDGKEQDLADYVKDMLSEMVRFNLHRCFCFCLVKMPFVLVSPYPSFSFPFVLFFETGK
jgi:hypothetical protein